MIRIIKTLPPFQYSVDLSILISALACMLILFSVIAYRPQIVVHIIEPETKPTELGSSYRIVTFSETLKEMYKKIRESQRDIRSAHIEEHSEYTAVMYATVPIGRYYLTGYNHEETGGKMTASGSVCHQGTITTCAADPRYHKFGEYLEIEGRLYRVEDTGSAVKKKHIDLYFAKYSDMAKYGSHYAEIYRVEFPFGKPKDY